MHKGRVAMPEGGGTISNGGSDRRLFTWGVLCPESFPVEDYVEELLFWSTPHRPVPGKDGWCLFFVVADEAQAQALTDMPEVIQVYQVWTRRD